MNTLLFAFILGVWLLSPTDLHANLLDKLGLTSKTNFTASSVSALPQDQIALGLKEALGKGVKQAVAQLGQTDGFLTNLNVRIAMPGKLQQVEKTLRSLKQEKLADDFVVTMNRAAEQAVPVASSVFADAVKQMSITDAKALLTGSDDAATEYFRRTTGTNLFARFLPIVKKSTDETGVTSKYKKLMERVGGGVTSTNKLVGTFSKGLNAAGYLNAETMDIDAYVTQKTMDGLFKMVADEEKKIRTNPAARTTDLLQKVFGTKAN